MQLAIPNPRGGGNKIRVNTVITALVLVITLTFRYYNDMHGGYRCCVDQRATPHVDGRKPSTARDAAVGDGCSGALSPEVMPVMGEELLQPGIGARKGGGHRGHRGSHSLSPGGDQPCFLR